MESHSGGAGLSKKALNKLWHKWQHFPFAFHMLFISFFSFFYVFLHLSVLWVFVFSKMAAVVPVSWLALFQDGAGSLRLQSENAQALMSLMAKGISFKQF